MAPRAAVTRGVWCSHLRALVEDPAIGLPILEPLRADASRYVADSVGNWLNDAAKSQPDWVRRTTEGWLRESPVPETRAIVRRGSRSFG